ncbi:MAG: hypothetical protein OHK0017_11520 [Patescibacteria group bacterium]
MRKFKQGWKNYAYTAYRLIEPVIDPIRLFNGLFNYTWFIGDALRYKKLNNKAKILTKDIYPAIHDKTSLTPFDAQYFHQQLWCFEQVMKSQPAKHVDIGSTYQMSGYLSKIVPTTFVDFRPIETNLPNLSLQKGDILDLPFEEGELESVSCLHVVEHIGLGRYGDSLNPDGSKLACRELARILKKDGRLYFSLPVGKQERLCFNAHRVHTVAQILEYFSDLKLVDFAMVTDSDKFIQNAETGLADTQDYACGMFVFTK